MNILEYENYQEKKSHGDLLFPYTTYICSIPLDFYNVPMHWHEEMELIYIKKGTGLVSIDFELHQVSAGSICLVLPGQLHEISQFENESMEYENIIFHPNILYSRQTDDCSRDFFKPLLTGKLLLPSIYTPKSIAYEDIAACIDGADEICKQYPTAYQFGLKSQLFGLFFQLFGHYGKESSAKHESTKQRSLEKLKQILKYLENHYMEKLTIADIAEEAGLSQSHFMKYFKTTMGTSFIEYLNSYRLTMAARLLLSSDSTILAISEEVGFDNLSNFNRLFRKKYNTTPSNYRKTR